MLRTPLVSIHDAPDPAPVLAWLDRFIATPPDLFIILTGEGLRRLLSLSERNGIEAAFTRALGETTLLCRGPKPERVLRQLRMKADIQAAAPTTEGVISTLQGMSIEGQNIGVQLYGDDPNRPLMEYLEMRGARVDTVAPYIYADESAESQVVALIDAILNGSVDAIAFTSKPQVRRLLQVARKFGHEEALKTGLDGCCVAAVGPVVSKQLQDNGIGVDIMPDQAFFMKPLVTEIMRYFRQE